MDTSLDVLGIITSMLGGLALFLFGMNTMSDSLSTVSGGVMDNIVGFLKKNRFFAFLFGTIITALVQSSSAITVLSVGLVNSAIIELNQAVGLIIGANLGTTATAWLLSLNSIDGSSLILTLLKPSTFAPFLAIAGVAVVMITKSEKKKSVGMAILGFSVMMIGMNLMSQGVAPLKELPELQDILVSFTNPFLGFLVAMVFAMIVQSSDAVVGIVQAFALAVGITFGMAVPLVCGAQVGTCITAFISSLGASRNGKRTALVNLYYNLLKTIPFLIIFYLLNSIFGFGFMDENVGGVGIPMFHTLINVVASVIWLPLANVIVWLANKTIPYNAAEKEEQAGKLTMLDEYLLGTPEIALNQTDKAVGVLAKAARESFDIVMHLGQSEENKDRAERICNRIANYNRQIDSYIRKISQKTEDKKNIAYMTYLSNTNLAFSKIGATSNKVLEIVRQIIEAGDKVDETDKRESQLFGEAIMEIITITTDSFIKKDIKLCGTVHIYREEIMEMADVVKKKHVKRVHETGRKYSWGKLFGDICYAEEQFIDYCDMVVEAMINYYEDIGLGVVDRTLSEEERQAIINRFDEKYMKVLLK